MGIIIKFADNKYSFTSNNYSNLDAIQKCIHYIFSGARKLPKGKRVYGAFGVPYRKEDEIIEYFNKFRDIQHDDHQSQLKHIIASFGNESAYLSTKQLQKVSRQICKYYYIDYPVAYAIHQKNDRFHLHIVVGTVSKSGKHLHISKKDWCRFKKHANHIWDKYSSYISCPYGEL